MTYYTFIEYNKDAEGYVVDTQAQIIQTLMNLSLKSLY